MNTAKMPQRAKEQKRHVRRKIAHVDELLDQAERRGNEGLGGDELATSKECQSRGTRGRYGCGVPWPGWRTRR